MKGFTKGLVQHRILIIILCIALVVPSVLGMVRTKTKYDLLYYLPQDLETVQGQEILLKDFGKGAFSLLVTEGMNLKDQADMENALKEIPHVDSVIGYASLTKGTLPVEIIPDDIRATVCFPPSSLMKVPPLRKPWKLSVRYGRLPVKRPL